MKDSSKLLPSGPFRLGDRVQLTSQKGRKNTISLETDGVFHSHKGSLSHAELLGLPDGSVVTNDAGETYLALRPLLSDYVMSMPRGAAIVYPKDAAQIVSNADIFPGATVIEAGVGSGALTLHLLRALAGQGELHSFERRQEFADIARANVTAFHGEAPENWQLTVGDLNEELSKGFADASVDRVVLDMLAPWECIDEAARVLKPGGIFLAYVATVTQLSRVAQTLTASLSFTHSVSSETLVRGWHVEGLAVRPDHRMVGHTGFLIHARRLAPGAILPEPKRRASKSDYTDEDVAAWTPDMIGEKAKSDKILRKKARQAQKILDIKNEHT